MLGDLPDIAFPPLTTPPISKSSDVVAPNLPGMQTAPPLDSKFCDLIALYQCGLSFSIAPVLLKTSPLLFLISLFSLQTATFLFRS
jgi:hypothetical protein